MGERVTVPTMWCPDCPDERLRADPNCKTCGGRGLVPRPDPLADALAECDRLADQNASFEDQNDELVAECERLRWLNETLRGQIEGCRKGRERESTAGRELANAVRGLNNPPDQLRDALARYREAVGE